MNKLLVFLTALVFLSGCSYPVEVTKRLPIFEYPKCAGLKKMELGTTIVIGYDGEFTMSKDFFGDNTVVMLPFPMAQINFKETVFLYKKSDVVKFIRCYVSVLSTLDKYKVVIKDNNSKATTDD